MATIKSFTTLEQSRKLAEILPLESADQTWERIAIVGANLDVPEEMQYRHNGDMLFQYYSGIGIPCWSLAALFKLLPKSAQLEKGNVTELCRVMLPVELEASDWYVEPIDACYEMILKLNELKML